MWQANKLLTASYDTIQTDKENFKASYKKVQKSEAPLSVSDSWIHVKAGALFIWPAQSLDSPEGLEEWWSSRDTAQTLRVRDTLYMREKTNKREDVWGTERDLILY